MNPRPCENVVWSTDCRGVLPLVSHTLSKRGTNLAFAGDGDDNVDSFREKMPAKQRGVTSDVCEIKRPVATEDGSDGVVSLLYARREAYFTRVKKTSPEGEPEAAVETDAFSRYEGVFGQANKRGRRVLRDTDDAWPRNDDVTSS